MVLDNAVKTLIKTHMRNVVNYWFIGIPVAVALAFHFHLGVAGLWTGLLVATSIQGDRRMRACTQFVSRHSSWPVHDRDRGCCVTLTDKKLLAGSSGQWCSV